MRVLLPKRLSSTLHQAQTLHPLSLAVRDEVVPCSSARMVLPEGETLSIKDWVRLYTAEGDAGIYRVTAMTPFYPGSTSVTLAHGFCALEDGCIEGSGTLEGTFAQIVGELLQHQETKAGETLLFALGDCADTPSIKLEYNNDKLLPLLKELCEKLPDHMATLDQSSIPWRVGCVALPDIPSAEGRFRRNMRSVSLEVDDDDHCTRLVVQRTATDGSKTYETYDADTISTYGVVKVIYEAPYNASDEDVRAFAAEYLRQHQEPTAAIDVDMVDLSAITGEPADRLRKGDLLRCCMLDYGVTVGARMMTVEHTDVFADPLAVRVSLRNKTRDASDLIRANRDEGRKNGRTGGRNSTSIQRLTYALNLTYDELTDLGEYYRALHNEVGIFMDATEAAITEYATSIETLFTDTEQLQQTTTSAWEHIDGMEGSITLHAERLLELGDEQESMIAELKVQYDEIMLRATQASVDALGEGIETMSTELAVAVDGVRLSVQQGDKILNSLQATIDGLENWVTDGADNISELVNTVRGLESTVSAAGGQISALTNTADGLTSMVTDQSGGLAEFATRIDEIYAQVQDANGNYTKLAVLTDQIAGTVSNATGNIGKLAITADDITAALTDQSGAMAAMQIQLDRIGLKVEDSTGALGAFTVEVRRIAGTITDASGKITSLMEQTDERFSTVVGDIKTIDGKVSDVLGSSIWQTRNDITAVVGNLYEKNGKLHVREGSGLVIDQNGVSYGVYTNDNLTAGVIVNKINGGTVKIKAENINLEGYVTADQLRAAEAAISNLTSGITVATSLKTRLLSSDTGFDYQGTGVKWLSGNFVTGVTFPVYQEKTIYYTDWSGAKQSMLVLTPTKNTVGRVTKSSDFTYLGA